MCFYGLREDRGSCVWEDVRFWTVEIDLVVVISCFVCRGVGKVTNTMRIGKAFWFDDVDFAMNKMLCDRTLISLNQLLLSNWPELNQN